MVGELNTGTPRNVFQGGILQKKSAWAPICHSFLASKFSAILLALPSQYAGIGSVLTTSTFSLVETFILSFLDYLNIFWLVFLLPTPCLLPWNLFSSKTCQWSFKIIRKIMSFLCSKFSKAYLSPTAYELNPQSSTVRLHTACSCPLSTAYSPLPHLLPLSPGHSALTTLVPCCSPYTPCTLFSSTLCTYSSAHSTLPADIHTADCLSHLHQVFAQCLITRSCAWISYENVNPLFPLLYSSASFLLIIFITFWHGIYYKCMFLLSISQ